MGNMRPVILALLYGLAGLVFIAIGIPLAVERVPPYHWYGFRSAKTFSIQTIWYAANRVAGIDLIIAGVVVALECWRCSFCARRCCRLCQLRHGVLDCP
jgi:hypothetical protein